MKITKEYLYKKGWRQDKNLYWHKDVYEYNHIDEILWIDGKKEGIWFVDTVEKLESLTIINHIEFN